MSSPTLSNPSPSEPSYALPTLDQSKPHGPIQDIPYRNPFWNRPDLQPLEAKTILMKDIREAGIENVGHGSVKKPTVHKDSKTALWYNPATHEEYKKIKLVQNNTLCYVVYLCWAACGPRWCGVVNADGRCGHGWLLFTNCKPVGWRDDGIRWKDGNVFELGYCGEFAGRYFPGEMGPRYHFFEGGRGGRWLQGWR